MSKWYVRVGGLAGRLLLIPLLPVLVLLKLLILPFEKPAVRTKQDVAKALRDFLDGTGGDWDWDDFISVPIRDPDLERIRARCAQIDQEFPADTPGRYCGDAGLQIVKGYLEALERRDV